MNRYSTVRKINNLMPFIHFLHISKIKFSIGLIHINMDGNDPMEHHSIPTGN